MDIYDSVINIAIIIGFNCISFYFGYRTVKSKIFILTHLFAHLAVKTISEQNWMLMGKKTLSAFPKSWQKR